MKTNITLLIITSLITGFIAGTQVPEDTLTHQYNGATISLPEEIDCAATGDTFIATQTEVDGRQVIVIGYLQRGQKHDRP